MLAVAHAAVTAEAMALSAQRSLQDEAAAATQAESLLAAAPVPAPAPAPTATPTTSLAGSVGAQMDVRVNGQTIGTTTMTNTQFTNFEFAVPTLAARGRKRQPHGCGPDVLKNRRDRP